jgi:hypothetical protein
MDVNPYESPTLATNYWAEQPKHAKMPVGVLLAVVWSGLVGLQNAVGWSLLFFDPAEVGINRGLSVFLIAIALGTAIVIAAIGTFLGHSIARYALGLLVAIQYGLDAHIAYDALGNPAAITGGDAVLIARTVHLIGTATVIVGYLVLSKKANAFFRR